MAKQTPTSHLVGLTKRKLRRISPPLSSSPGENRGRAPKLVSYCPECQPTNVAHPQYNVHVSVTARTKTASCKAGHIWKVVG